MKVGAVYIDEVLIAVLAFVLSAVSLILTYRQNRRMAASTERMANDNARMAVANEQMAATNREMLVENRRTSAANARYRRTTHSSRPASISAAASR